MSQTGVRNALLAVTAVLIGVLLLAVGFLGRLAIEPDSEPGSQANNATATTGDISPETLNEIIAILQQDFVEPGRVDPELLYQGAIQGIFTELNDPHSLYIDPSTYAVSRDDFSGAFQGIGA